MYAWVRAGLMVELFCVGYNLFQSCFVETWTLSRAVVAPRRLVLSLQLLSSRGLCWVRRGDSVFALCGFTLDLLLYLLSGCLCVFLCCVSSLVRLSTLGNPCCCAGRLAECSSSMKRRCGHYRSSTLV